jgi:deoxyribodipyrimidine photolyase-related protein
MPVRNLIIVLGDQLDPKSEAFDGFEKSHDAVWMAEVVAESKHVWSHKARIALFLTAMRHFRDDLEKRKFQVHYRRLDDRGNRGDFATELEAAVKKHAPEKLIMVEPGEWRVRELFRTAADDLDVPLDMRPDRHFLCSHEEFARHAEDRKQLRLEYFYREMRRKADVLMDGDKPAGGDWNYDSENRAAFPKSGPENLPPQKMFRKSKMTKEVLKLVEKEFSDHPGKLDHFDWPVTRKQAKQALDDFIDNRLANFGQYQDAMWAGEPYLYHSRLSAAMNLKLLDPREVIYSAEAAYHAGLAPLSSVEGFVRQILG